jgi:hypothetical protein
MTLARRQHQASLMIEELAGGRSDMAFSVPRPVRGLRCPARLRDITGFSQDLGLKPQFMAGLHARAKKAVI